MPYRYDNGVLAECDECIHRLRQALYDEQEIEFLSSLPGPLQDSALEFIVASMYRHFGGNERPAEARKRVEDLLEKQGQFETDEVHSVFEDNAFQTKNYSPEFEEQYEPEELLEFLTASWGGAEEDNEVPEETKYNFPFFGCDVRIEMGFCVMDPETLECPDCGMEVQNTPDNVSFGPENDLLCPSCVGKREDEFDSRGVVIEGNPLHHGRWDTQEPGFRYTGTDYFAVTHPSCRGTEGDDPGIMLLTGVWMDDASRLVLGLRCQSCGARNALKPFTDRAEPLSLLNASGAEWKSVESRAAELLEAGENEDIDFKATMRRNLGTGDPDLQAEHSLMKEVAGFLNATGGQILLGVKNDKTVIGLGGDYQTFPDRQDADKLELHFNNMIEKYTGDPLLRSLVTFEVEQLQGKDVAVLLIDPSPNPVFLNLDGEETFFVRNGTNCQKLEGHALASYIAQTWPRL